MSRLLVVEDDADIAGLMRLYLEKAGHSVDVLASGGDVIARSQVEPPDVIVLDIMLPGLDGLAICRALRADPATADLAIIIVSAKGEEADRIHGLELGADDYLTKPFSPKELVARVAALERRAGRQTDGAVVELEGITVDRDQHVIRNDGREVALTAKEYLLFDYFLKHRGRVLSRERLLTDVWGYQYAGGTRTVDVHVRRLRKKLPPLSRRLSTVHQFGYKLT